MKKILVPFAVSCMLFGPSLIVASDEDGGEKVWTTAALTTEPEQNSSDQDAILNSSETYHVNPSTGTAEPSSKNGKKNRKK